MNLALTGTSSITCLRQGLLPVNTLLITWTSSRLLGQSGLIRQMAEAGMALVNAGQLAVTPKTAHDGDLFRPLQKCCQVS